LRFKQSLARPLVLGAVALSLSVSPRPLWAQESPAGGEAAGGEAGAVAPAVILSARGREVTLSVGSNNGVAPGAIFGVTRDGQVRARMRVREVRPDDSTAVVLGGATDADMGFTIGDSASLLARSSPEPEPDPAPAAIVEMPPATVPVEIIPADPGTSTPPATLPPVLPPQTVPVASTGRATVLITGINGNEVSLAGGASEGLRAGLTLPVVRDGTSIAMLRVQSTAGATSTARLLWRDETVPVTVGDLVAVPTGAGTPSIPGSGGTTLAANPAAEPAAPGFEPIEGGRTAASEASGPVPAAPARFETGASNITVPRADRAYEYLAAIAADGLLPRLPAHLFHDEGTRAHRTAEDILFTRAQIAQMIREALANAEANAASSENGELGSKSRLALSALSREFARDIRALGTASTSLAAAPASDASIVEVPVETVSPDGTSTSTSSASTEAASTSPPPEGSSENPANLSLASEGILGPRRGFEFGISGQQRLSAVSSSGANLEPFSERQGGRRSRSGLDTRTNIFARAGSRLEMFATIDAGSDPRDDSSPGFGLAPFKDRRFEVRRALVSYDAGRLLRGLRVEAGRQEFWWGPGQFGTLLLSDTAGPLNSVRAIFKRGSYSIEGMYSPLGRGPVGGARSLYGHNYQVNIGPRLRLGFAETVLSPKERLDPILFAAAFSPIPLVAVERRGDTEGDNVLGQAYIEAGLARGANVYGEFLIDDIGANNANRAVNRVGTLIGARLFLPRDPSKLGATAEFATLQGRTYLRFGNLDPDYDYFYRGRPLGYPVAPLPGPALPGLAGLGGAQSLRLEAYWRPIPRLRLSGGFEFADLNSERPILSRQQTLRLRASYDIARNFTLTLRAQRVSTSQPNFVLNEAAVKQRLFQLEVARSY
jgi:hypothetical protein